MGISGTRGFSQQPSHYSTSNASPEKPADASNLYGRVVDVILNEKHPRYKDMGGSQAIYGVFYNTLSARDPENPREPALRFAYPGQNTVRQIPTKGEIVQLSNAPAVAAQEVRSGGTHYLEKTYWISIVPVWNHPHLNFYPDTLALPDPDKIDLGPDFNKESGKGISPLQLAPGDVSLEGRFGQSLRFGGTKYQGSPLANDENNGKPYTVIRNGQGAVGERVSEDVVLDDSSIYLTSDHRVPLLEANRKFEGAVTPPPFANEYKGKQIVVSSDRVFLNARENDIELAAKGHVGLNGKTTSIDGEDYVGVDAKEIYLGTYAKSSKNPVPRGKETIQILKDLITTLINLLKIMGKSSNVATAWMDGVITIAGSSQASLESIISRLEHILSDKVFVE